MGKKICRHFKVTSTVLLIISGLSSSKAQNKPEVSAGADIVSGYIWRGMDCGGVSIQPSLSVARYGFSLTAWGSAGIESKDTKEVDLTLVYRTGHFMAGIVDYWFDNTRASDKQEKYFDYAAHTTAHVFEGMLGYDSGILTLSWNTNFTGNDYYKANHKRAYSTYIEAAAPFKLGDVDFLTELGVTPWEGLYSTGFNVVHIGLKATKEIRITDSFSIPAFVKLVMNPNSEGTYFIFGMSF